MATLPDDMPDRSEPVISQSELRERLAGKTVAILGCGGLGSNCSAMLVRSGVLALTLVDLDQVEAENLNRQMFLVEQIGMRKVEALADTLRRIDPNVALRLIDERIDQDNLAGMVLGADVIVEAVDSAETKAMILNVCTRDMPQTPLVSASGLAGVASANRIETIELAQNLWVAGDLESDIRDGHALAAPRVMVVAAHQAHAVVRILLGFSDI